jgi:hypothetical protein
LSVLLVEQVNTFLHTKIGAQIFKIKEVLTKRTSFGEKKEEQAHGSA